MIFSTVSTFVEQVGRRLTWRYAELDNMICIWTGPASGALSFKPSVNSPHPDYPLMFVTDSEITVHEGSVSEVQVTYQGIIQTSGVKQYYTDPIVTLSPVGGSRDFTRLYVQQVSAAQYTTLPNQGGVPVTVQNAPAFFNYGTQSVTVRYIGTQCSVRYQVYPGFSGPHFNSLGLSNVMWQVLSTTYGAVSIIGSNVEQQQIPSVIPGVGGVPPLFKAYMGMQAEQKGKWWVCTEIYGPTF